jgi:hypothetical protein
MARSKATKMALGACKIPESIPKSFPLSASEDSKVEDSVYFTPDKCRTRKEMDRQYDEWQQYIGKRDKMLKEYGISDGPFQIFALTFYNKGCKAAVDRGHNDRFWDLGIFGREFQKQHDISSMFVLGAGVRMEEIANEVKATSTELENAIKILKESVNQIRGVADVVGPEMIKVLQDIRSTRMATTVEARQITEEIKGLLRPLGDVRNFFLESNYEVEMSRLERFVKICWEIKKLKEEGIFDSIVETSIKMAIKEEKKCQETKP